ncbi:MAG: CoA-binding protein [Hasllibacter sp.]
MDPLDADLRRILTRTRAIALVGISANEVRPSFYVARYLSLKGYRVIGVNPGLAGREMFGETVRGDLAEMDEGVDMVDVFRRPEAVPAILDAALAHLPNLRTFWMQIGVRHEGAAARARAAGLDVVQDRCTKMEHQRLSGDLAKGGFATGRVSSRL